MLQNENTFLPVPNRITMEKSKDISFYRRSEPSKGINFLSDISKQLLLDCLQSNTANPFFELIDNYKTQADPSFCGLSNLVITLNALKVDPKTKWKGIWRWYSEENIMCNNIEKVKDYGMTLSEFGALLNCNGVKNKIYRPVNENFALNTVIDMNNINKTLYDDIKENKYSCVTCDEHFNSMIPFNIVSKEFMSACALASAKYNTFFMMCNLGRKGLNQTGDGHFTPIAAYNAKKDIGLLLESARFKYDSRWYSIEDIYNSLIEKDSFTNKPRGFLLIEKKEKEEKKVEVDEEVIVDKIKMKK